MIKKKINHLVETIKQSTSEYKYDDIKEVEKFINLCAKYVESVIAMESVINISRFRLDTESYQLLVTELDRSRRLTHDAVITSVNLLNRLCNYYNVEKIYSGSNDRLEVAEFAKKVVDEYFQERKK